MEEEISDIEDNCEGLELEDEESPVLYEHFKFVAVKVKICASR